MLANHKTMRLALRNTRVALFIPVLNPGRENVQRLCDALRMQTLMPHEIVVADSESTDGSPAIFAEQLGARILRVKRANFDHGGTRNLAFSEMTADIYVFLTQDAIPSGPKALELLVRALVDDHSAGVAYGRQLPHPDAGPFARHARLFNYPSRSRRFTRSDIPRVGVRAAFCSNSFAAYRRDAIMQIGGFPEEMIFGEDTAAVARMLERGWSSVYAAEAPVFHSHDYSLKEEFARYFDAGTFHSRERWFTEMLAGPTREGIRFVRSELDYLRSQNVSVAALHVIIRNGVRWVGYRIGRAHRFIPVPVRCRIGMNRGYWRQTA